MFTEMENLIRYRKPAEWITMVIITLFVIFVGLAVEAHEHSPGSTSDEKTQIL